MTAMPQIRIALAQVEIGNDVEENLHHCIGSVASAAEGGAAAICFPELSCLPFFPHARANPKYFDLAEAIPGPRVNRFQDAAAKHGIVVVLNVYEATSRYDYYDTTVAIDADGSIRGSYRMTHKAESSAFNESFYYWRGDSGFPAFETAIGRIGLATCYDRHFPEVFRCLALEGAWVVFVPNAISVHSIEHSRNFFEMPNQAASMANGIFTVCVNRSGPGGCVEFLPEVPRDKFTFAGASFVTAPDGRITAQAEVRAEQLLITTLDTAEVQKARHQRPFFRDRRPECYGRLLRS
jgi:N-carbamoylputrescine amidase